MSTYQRTIVALLMALLPLTSLAMGSFNIHMTDSSIGYDALLVFIIAYLFVMGEEFFHLRKSKPVVLSAGLIWVMIALDTHDNVIFDQVIRALDHNILEYAELFLFLLVAMTYVNAMEERNVFAALRCWLLKKGFSYRSLFWVTGILAFVISPIADNLTTALLMCAVVMAVGIDSPKFVSIGCINIVVAANAGGAFSPFGDITTLMVWQKGMLHFFEFFHIFIPSVVSYVIPAACMHFAVPKLQPKPQADRVIMKIGAKRVVILFILTIITAVTFHNTLHLPPMLGMMTGLSYLNFFAYYLQTRELKMQAAGEIDEALRPFDVFKKIKRAEWDTLLFFYGVLLSVGGLATIGFLDVVSHIMYTEWGANLPTLHSATPANASVGILSAIVDNIPVMYAVLSMKPSMSQGQWLLVTLTAGIGGSLLSVGSAAGVALMGQAKGVYTFFSHLRWSWAILLGYLAAIGTHIVLNHKLFLVPAH